MTIDEAIGILAAKKLDDVERHAEDSAAACQLGIEALKQVRDCQSGEQLTPDFYLPGQTKD